MYNTWTVYEIQNFDHLQNEYSLFFSKFSLGIQTSQDARFYAISKKFTPFSNKDKTLVIQFTVKHEQNIDCGGGYIKVFDCSLDQKDMHGETPYEIMFGKSSHQDCVIDNLYSDNDPEPKSHWSYQCMASATGPRRTILFHMPCV